MALLCGVCDHLFMLLICQMDARSSLSLPSYSVFQAVKYCQPSISSLHKDLVLPDSVVTASSVVNIPMSVAVV